jgi:hypothetical protein
MRLRLHNTQILICHNNNIFFCQFWNLTSVLLLSELSLKSFFLAEGPHAHSSTYLPYQSVHAPKNTHTPMSKQQVSVLPTLWRCTVLYTVLCIFHAMLFPCYHIYPFIKWIRITIQTNKTVLKLENKICKRSWDLHPLIYITAIHPCSAPLIYTSDLHSRSTVLIYCTPLIYTTNLRPLSTLLAYTPGGSSFFGK